MKTMSCLDCEETFQAETPVDMQKAMMPHYMEKHKDIMAGLSQETKDEWMARFQKEWDKAN